MQNLIIYQQKESCKDKRHPYGLPLVERQKIKVNETEIIKGEA